MRRSTIAALFSFALLCAATSAAADTPLLPPQGQASDVLDRIWQNLERQPMKSTVLQRARAARRVPVRASQPEVVQKEPGDLLAGLHFEERLHRAPDSQTNYP